MNDEAYLPLGWCRTVFENFAELVNGRAYKRHEMLTQGTPLLRIQNLNGGDKWFYSDMELHPNKYCEPGDLLYAWSATFGPYIYKGPRAIYHYHIWKVLPRLGMTNKFGFHLLGWISDAVKAKARGVAMPHMTKGGMEAWPVLLPPPPEQRRIVAKIEALQKHSDAAKAALHAIPKLLDQLRQSILAAAFRGDLTRQWRQDNPDVEPASVLLERIRAERKARFIEDTAEKARAKLETKALAASKPWTKADNLKALEWERTKAEKKYKAPQPVDTTDLPELPEGWCWARWEEVAYSSLYGPRFGKNEYMDGGIPMLRTTDMDSLGRIVLKEPPTIAEPAARLDEWGLVDGDILVTRSGSIGRCAVYTSDLGPALPSAYLIRFRMVVDTFTPRFALLFLLSPNGQHLLGTGATAVTQANVNAKTINSFPLPLPPLGEQIEIVRQVDRVVDGMDTQNRRFRRLLDSMIPQANQSILSKAFRGELVPQDPNDKPASVLLERIAAERGQAEAVAKAAKKNPSKKRFSRKRSS